MDPNTVEEEDPEEPEEPGKHVWVYCAPQWERCQCPGKIRWGSSGKWQIVELHSGSSHTTVECSVDADGLTDVAPGDGGKHCECSMRMGTHAHRSINPFSLEKGMQVRPGTRMVGDCKIYERKQGEGEHGAALWSAAKDLCAQSGGKKRGDRALSPTFIRKLMKVYIDAKFVKNYDSFTDTHGWVDRAFVTACAMPPEGEEAAQAQQLLRSVHLFSKYPIVVINFGMSTPRSWTASRYPRMILLHGAPLGGERSASIDKMRAMLLSRVRTGIFLKVDEWVGPHVDKLFESTERESTQQYPMPILPTHFLDKNPEAGFTDWWYRFCPTSDKCKLQTTRWNHNHPTWSFWALPFFGKWLRRNLRDETIPPRSDMKHYHQDLRITDVPTDEDLINLAIWEEHGTKQWCKFDLPDPAEFETLLGGKHDGNRCVDQCNDMPGDSRFHKSGVPKVFYTACSAVNPHQSEKYIERLNDMLKAGTLPPPILFHNKFYHDGEELRKDHPHLKCLI